MTIGRPSKGPRVRTSVAFPIGVPEIGQEHAKALGYDGMGDWVVSLVVKELGLPELAPKKRKSHPQEEMLPMTG